MDAFSLQRLSARVAKKGIPFFPSFLCSLFQLIFSCKLPPECKISPHAKIAYHGLGVLMVAGTVIGDDCMIGVGAKFIRKFPYKNVPRLGKRVYVGPGAVICGPVIIEDDVIVAANAVVTKSVPSGCVVAGVPAKIIGQTKKLGYDVFSNPKYMDGDASWMKSE